MGAAIKAARDAQGLSLRAFADRLEGFGLPISYAALSRIEGAQRPVSVRELLVIAAALDVSPDVLVFPDEDNMPVPLTDELVENAGRLRDWWAGRRHLGGTLRRAPRPSWPFPDELKDNDRRRERGEHWLRHRPTLERRAFARDGVLRLVSATHRLVEAAGRHAKPTTQDRMAIVRELSAIKEAFREVVAAPDVAHLPEAREYVQEVEAILLAAARASEQAEGDNR